MTPSKVTVIRPNATELAQRRAKLDEYGEVKRRLELVAADEDREGVLKKEIQSWYKDSDPSKPETADGDYYRVNLTARRNERTIRNKRKAWNALKKALGMDGLIAALDLPLGMIDKHVPESEQKEFMHEERSGYRTLNVVALHAVVETPKAA